MATAADVEDARLPAGTEALVGSVVRAVGKQSLGSHVAIERNALHDPRPLVHQLHGPADTQEQRGQATEERQKDNKDRKTKW